MGAPQLQPVVTLAALYGAGGSAVGATVAERLDVPFFDRGVAQAVASRTGLPVGAVAALDDEPRSGLGRLAANLGRLSTVTGEADGSFERLDIQERAVRGHIEQFLAHCRVTGGVVVGRGGMVLLQSVPGALHVSLRGPREARVRRAAVEFGIEPEVAARRQKAEDRARKDYVRRVYGLDGDDPSLYHVVLDSTALSLEVCVDLIVAAATARVRASGPIPPT
jgi:hypothetical protein